MYIQYSRYSCGTKVVTFVSAAALLELALFRKDDVGR